LVELNGDKTHLKLFSFTHLTWDQMFTVTRASLESAVTRMKKFQPVELTAVIHERPLNWREKFFM